MPLTVRGSAFSTACELFEKCHKGDAHKYSLELKAVRYSYDQIPRKETKIGTIDATSCIGIVYRTPDKTTYVQHHDGRSLKSFTEVIDSKSFKGTHPVQVTLVGGCKKVGDKYANLEKHTKENLEKLVKFWHESTFNIDVQGWAIGNENGYEELCSDFVADHEKTYLIKQGEVGFLNVEMNGTLIPQLPRRLATVLSEDQYFFVNSRCQKSLRLSHASNIHLLKRFAEQLIKLDDALILKTCSTTPEIEPPYYSKIIREMAAYVLYPHGQTAIEIPLLKGHSIFGLQGEVIKM